MVWHKYKAYHKPAIHEFYQILSDYTIVADNNTVIAHNRLHLQPISFLIGFESDLPETTFIFIASRKFLPRLQSNLEKDALPSLPPSLCLCVSLSFMPLAVTHKIGWTGFTLSAT